jgi:hypothetical protein
MKMTRIFGLMIAVGFLLAGTSVLAGGTNTPTPVVIDQSKDNVPSELKEIKALRTAFEAKRDAYLAAQKALIEKLKGATEEERERIREQLQDNREAFLAALREFREDIRHELAEIKQIIRNHDKDILLDASTAPHNPHHPKGGN